MSPFGSRAWINNRNIERGIGEIEMNADPKHKGGHDDVDRAKRARRHQERGARRCPQEYLPGVRSGFDCNIGSLRLAPTVQAPRREEPASHWLPHRAAEGEGRTVR